MDLAFRKAEQAFLADPHSADALIRYWSACLRIGFPLELQALQPSFSCNRTIEEFLTKNNELITAFGLPLSHITDMILQRITEDLEQNDDEYIAGDENTGIAYLGWLPRLFDLRDSVDEFIRNQIFANGVYALIGYKIGEAATRMSGFYLSAFFLEDQTSNLVFDIESIVRDGRRELRNLHKNSCEEGDFISPKLVQRRYKRPVEMLKSLNELYLENPNTYIPLIDVMQSPFNKNR